MRERNGNPISIGLLFKVLMFNFFQLFATTGWLDYRQLNIISLISVSLATAVAFCIPKVENTIYFHNSKNKNEQNDQVLDEGQPKPLIKLVQNFKSSFSQGSVFRWSLWWALGMCGNYQVCF